MERHMFSTDTMTGAVGVLIDGAMSAGDAAASWPLYVSLRWAMRLAKGFGTPVQAIVLDERKDDGKDAVGLLNDTKSAALKSMLIRMALSQDVEVSMRKAAGADARRSLRGISSSLTMLVTGSDEAAALGRRRGMEAVPAELAAGMVCPLLVVPDLRDTDDDDAGKAGETASLADHPSGFPPKTVVVGYDGSRQSVEAVRWGIRLAAIWNATVDVVTAVRGKGLRVPISLGMIVGRGDANMGDAALAGDWRNAFGNKANGLRGERAAERLSAETLDAVIAETRVIRPDMAIERHAVQGAASDALLAAATPESVIVIGADDADKGPLSRILGSTGRRLIAYSPVPVLVCPA